MPDLNVKLGEKVIQKYLFDKEVMSIGRARDNDIVIENLSVSRNHARIRRSDAKYILTDLNSANGTFVNNVRVNKIELFDGDTITIGKHTIQFENKKISDEQLISDAFGAERTMIVDRTPAARIVIEKGKQRGQEFKITKDETYIGRSSDNDICLHDWFVSKKHAMIFKEGLSFFIKDLKSWRGSMLNGKFTREAPLKDGDTLQFGSTVMNFYITGAPEMLQITGRVPREIVEEETPYPEEDIAQEVEKVLSDEMKDTQSAELEEELRAEEEEVAKMQAAWEQLTPEPEKIPLEGEVQEQQKVVVKPFIAPVELVKDKWGMEEVTLEPKSISEPPEAHVKVEKEHMPEVREKAKPLEVPADLPKGVNPKEVEVWLKALHNPSRIIRKQAAQFLKKLTGKIYDYE
jgi:pSer/pThr/pTyr-binding forkhead associated (FHA) protein